MTTSFPTKPSNQSSNSSRSRVIEFPRGREVLLGVGAGIAAYKACDLLRRLQDHGFLVTVIPTESSLNFVGRTTWEALSGRTVETSLWSNASAVSHISVAESSDLVIIAPATADLMARIASGRADDLLTTTVLATTSPILMVPAMHPQMWLNPATQANVATLRSRGIHVMEPATGRLTGKDSGVGRFPETASIISEVQSITRTQARLIGRSVLITAGGTREAIDAVRFIGNRSSGRQGLAVAYEALREGAEVTIVAANTDPFELPGATVLNVESALEMQEALVEEFPRHDALVMAAAVADVRPDGSVQEKIKKEDLSSLNLVRNPDLLAEIAQTKRHNQVLVGFAAETEDNFEELGREKLARKGLDVLYVNQVVNGKVFGESLTTGSLLTKESEIARFVESDKYDVARSIVNEISKRLVAVNG